MKSWTISETSLLWRWASVYGSASKYHPPEDLCTFMRNLFWGVIVWLIAVFFAGVGGAILGDIGAWIYTMIELGYYIQPDPLAGVALSIIAAFGILFGAAWIAATVAIKRREKREAREAAGLPEPEPSILLVWIKSIKEKTCVRINIGS